MEEAAKETVIIVHGTWAAPKPGVIRWYQPGEGATTAGGFVNKLDAALQKRGSPARCWAHCTNGNHIFHWSGDNSWIVRTRAASAFADYVAKLRKERWHCHIVAHSHGGNVLAEALPQMITVLGSNEGLGKFVTLGTPFMDTTSPILQRVASRNRILNLASWAACIFLPYLFISWIFNYFEFVCGYFPEVACRIFEVGPSYLLSWSWGGPVILLFVFLFLVGAFFRRRKTTRVRSTSGPGQTEPQLLVVGSFMDEPWQILHHMRSIDNPLTVKSNVLTYLLSSLRFSGLQSAQVARIHGAKSFRDLALAAKVVMLLMYLSCFLLVFSVLVSGLDQYYYASGDYFNAVTPTQQPEAMSRRMLKKEGRRCSP